MHIPDFLARRDGLLDTTSQIQEDKCQPFRGKPFKWCVAADAAYLFFLIAIFFIFACFAIMVVRGLRSTTKRSNNKLYRRLSLPYPVSGSSEFAQYSGYDYDTKRDSVNSSATLVDPYHVVNKLDKSLIAQDNSFNGVSIPQQAFDQKATVKLASGLGLGITIEDDSSQSADSPEDPPNGNEKTATPPPAQAHVRQAWWDS